MAAINFVKGEQYYTAEFQINGPVNVHIERAEAGALYFRQRSIDHGSYDLINGANWNNRGDLTIDTAIQGVVYPIWIKIESASEPTLAEMVEGEQSGGGAGTESTMEYLDVSELSEQNITQIRTFAFMAKADVTDFIIVAPAMYIRLQESASNFNRYLAFGLDLKAEVVQGDIRMTINDLLKDSGFDIGSIPRITEEQFYNLEA